MPGSHPGRSRKFQKPLLVFFSAERLGPGAWTAWSTIWRGTLVLVKRTVARVEGRAKATEIEELVEPYLPEESVLA